MGTIMKRRAWPGLLLLAIDGLLRPDAALATLEFHPVFRPLDGTSGLPDSQVEAIVQDRYGYVWIGTRSGLVRHEGSQLSLLPRDPRQPGALPDNNITTLHAHSDGMVWAGVYDAGVVEIGPDLLPRRHLAPVSQGGVLPYSQVWSMAEDCEGHLWLAFMRGGLARFDPRSEELLMIEQSEDYGLTSQGFQVQIQVDSQCRIWLAQTHRLGVLSPDAETPRFEAVLAGGADIRQFIISVAEHPLGILVGRGRELLVVTESAGHPKEFEVQQLASFQREITNLQLLPDDRVAVSTAMGLVLLDPATGWLEQIGERPDLFDALPSNALGPTALVDHEGALWLGVIRSGLVYLPPEHATFARLQRGYPPDGGFALERVTVVSPGISNDVIWVAADEGIQRLDLAAGTITPAHDLFPGYPNPPGRRGNRGLLERPGELVVLTAEILGAYGQPPRLIRGLLEARQMGTANFTLLEPEGPDAVWVATETQGLALVDLESAEFTHFGPDQPWPYQLPERAPKRMRRDAEAGLILAGATTVYRYDPDQGFIAVADVAASRITDLAFAGPGHLWVGQGNGLSEWRWHDGRFELLRDHDITALLERSSLHRVFPLRDDEIWLVLSNGLARLNPQTGESRLFTRGDGLPAAEPHPDASLMLPDGRIVVGSNRGLVLINPEHARSEAVPPPVHLTRVIAGNLDWVLIPGDRPPLALDWRQRSIRFHFSALTFIAPDRVRYRVRLQGWDADWIELRSLGQMYYSNLRPGRYRFEVQAATATGRWNEAGDHLVIDLAAAPWASPLAHAAYVALTLMAIAAIWITTQRTRRRRLQLQQEAQKRKLAEGQRNLLERLNADLAPLPLAQAIMTELLALTGAEWIRFAYVHEQMPSEPMTLSAGKSSSPETWPDEPDRADDPTRRRVVLTADREPVAEVALVASERGFPPDHEQRLGLLVGLAGQALHNSLLLQRVKHLAQRAETANQAKSEFLATMSHEIRTPLHGVLGMADLIHELETDPDKLDLIDTLRGSGQQLQRIINDVLDISRIESGRVEIAHEPFELVSLLEQVIDLHAPNAARKQLDLRLSIQSNLPLLAWGDPDRLSQILGNLISNAVKFTAAGAVELAALQQGDDRLVFAVRDSGPGIPASERGRLFQPFSQLDASISREHGGSGLGLAICQQLAEAMGGKVRLEDRRWPGSTFVLSLPQRTEAVTRPLSTQLSALTIVALVEAPTYRVLHRLARRWGFRLRNGWHCPPAAGALLLVDGRFSWEDPRLAAWAECCAEGFCLQSPYLHQPAGSERQEHPLRFLRWPLQEGRLLAALFDHLLQ